MKRKVPLPTVVEQSLRKNPNLKPSEVVRQSILKGLKADVVDWEELEKTTDALLNTKEISNLKAKINKENNPAGIASRQWLTSSRNQTRKISISSTK